MSGFHSATMKSNYHPSVSQPTLTKPFPYQWNPGRTFRVNQENIPDKLILKTSISVPFRLRKYHKAIFHFFTVPKRSLGQGNVFTRGAPPGQRRPCTVKSGRYASYWNAFLFLSRLRSEMFNWGIDSKNFAGTKHYKFMHSSGGIVVSVDELFSSINTYVQITRQHLL